MCYVGSACGSVRQCAAVLQCMCGSAAVAVCGSAAACAPQCAMTVRHFAAVRAEVRGSASGSVRQGGSVWQCVARSRVRQCSSAAVGVAVHAAEVCGSASVWQCAAVRRRVAVRQCAALRHCGSVGNMRQYGSVHGRTEVCGIPRGSVWLCTCGSVCLLVFYDYIRLNWIWVRFEWNQILFLIRLWMLRFFLNNFYVLLLIKHAVE
jgi:hypothetical protein